MIINNIRENVNYTTVTGALRKVAAGARYAGSAVYEVSRAAVIEGVIDGRTAYYDAKNANSSVPGIALDTVVAAGKAAIKAARDEINRPVAVKISSEAKEEDFGAHFINADTINNKSTEELCKAVKKTLTQSGHREGSYSINGLLILQKTASDLIFSSAIEMFHAKGWTDERAIHRILNNLDANLFVPAMVSPSLKNQIFQSAPTGLFFELSITNQGATLLGKTPGNFSTVDECGAPILSSHLTVLNLHVHADFNKNGDCIRYIHNIQ